MRPREFFQEIAKVNACHAQARPGDLRVIVNAIMTLDAFFGVLHATLRDSEKLEERSDDRWKEELARQNPDYRLLRDCAYALKHGRLDDRKARLVRHPAQIEPFPASFDASTFDQSAFDTETVWIDTSENDFRADEVIQKVASFAEDCLARYAL